METNYEKGVEIQAHARPLDKPTIENGPNFTPSIPQVYCNEGMLENVGIAGMEAGYLEDSDIDMVIETPNLGASLDTVLEIEDLGVYEEGHASMHLD